MAERRQGRWDDDRTVVYMRITPPPKNDRTIVATARGEGPTGGEVVTYDRGGHDGGGEDEDAPPPLPPPSSPSWAPPTARARVSPSLSVD